MAYKALYRTYRPNGFDEVAGQTHIVKTLQNAVNQNKIAHAYLFCGPRGTGKTSIAKIFAKAVNCEAEDHRPCLECENCKAIGEGSHPDVVEIDAASNNGVEEVRDLIEKVKYAPIKGKYKVYIIDEVHMMSTGAFNALLKTIEEPPAHVIFILATTEPHKVLPTIISRCQRFDFTKVGTTDITARIHEILKSENITCEDEVIRIISQLADGGMRDALSILDQCIAYAQDDIKVHHINEIYGITTIKEKISILECVYQKNASDLLDKVYSLAEKGTDIKRLTVDLIEILKETVIYDYTKEVSLLRILNQEEVRSLIKDKMTKERLAMIDVLMDTYDKYRSASSVSSYFEVCLLKMMDIDLNLEVKPIARESTTPKQVEIAAPVQKETVVKEIQKVIPEENVSRETFVQDDGNDFDDEDLASLSALEEPMPHQPVILDEPIIKKTIEVHENKSAVPLKDEFVLALLAGADKNERKGDAQEWRKIPDYLLEFQWAKQASILRKTDIMASNEKYLILSVDIQATANEINEKDSKDEFLPFMQELLKKKKKIFAVTNEQRKRVTENYLECMKNNTLPQPIEFGEFEENKEKKPDEMSEEEIVLDLFGEGNVIITEE